MIKKDKKQYKSDFIDCLISAIIFLAIGIVFAFDSDKVEGIAMLVLNVLLSLLFLFFGIDNYMRMKNEREEE